MEKMAESAENSELILLFEEGVYKVIKGQCSKYLTLAAKVAGYLFQNSPWSSSSGGAKSDLQVLLDLAGKIFSGIKETELGK